MSVESELNNVNVPENRIYFIPRRISSLSSPELQNIELGELFIVEDENLMYCRGRAGDESTKDYFYPLTENFHTYHLFNSPPFREFYKDKSNYTALVNPGWFPDDRNYKDYYFYRRDSNRDMIDFGNDQGLINSKDEYFIEGMYIYPFDISKYLGPESEKEYFKNKLKDRRNNNYLIAAPVIEISKGTNLNLLFESLQDQNDRTSNFLYNTEKRISGRNETLKHHRTLANYHNNHYSEYYSHYINNFFLHEDNNLTRGIELEYHFNVATTNNVTSMLRVHTPNTLTMSDTRVKSWCDEYKYFHNLNRNFRVITYSSSDYNANDLEIGDSGIYRCNLIPGYELPFPRDRLRNPEQYPDRNGFVRTLFSDEYLITCRELYFITNNETAVALSLNLKNPYAFFLSKFNLNPRMDSQNIRVEADGLEFVMERNGVRIFRADKVNREFSYNQVRFNEIPLETTPEGP